MTKGTKLYVYIVSVAQAAGLFIAVTIFGFPFDEADYDEAEMLFGLVILCWIGVTLMLAKSVYQTGSPKTCGDIAVTLGGMAVSSFLLLATLLYGAGADPDVSQNEFFLFHNDFLLIVLAVWGAILGFGVAALAIALIARRIRQRASKSRETASQNDLGTTVGDQ